MNELDKVLKLIEAGYSKDDIDKLIAPVVDKKEEQEVKEDKKEEVKETPEVPESESDLRKELNELKNSLRELTTTMQGENIRRSERGELEKPKTASDILAGFLK